MKIYKEKSPLYPNMPECTNYALYTLDDWDEYEKILKKNGDFLNTFYSFKEDFIKYIGKTWTNKYDYSHTKKGAPVANYKVIGMEDNNAMLDWYFIVQNIEDENDIQYVLVNSTDIEEGLID